MMTRKTTLWLFLGLWILLYALSVVVPMNMAPTGDGFTRGADRVLTFLSLQFAASLMVRGPGAGPRRRDRLCHADLNRPA